MRLCSICHREVVDPYKGMPSRCGACHRAAVKANRQAKLAYYQAYDRQRSDDPDRVATRERVRAARRADPTKKAIDDARKKDWAEQNELKRAAHFAVNNAIRDGKLKPQPCERCGFALGVDAHHEDYSKPLDVTWLCKTCHGQRHREINAEKRKDAA